MQPIVLDGRVGYLHTPGGAVRDTGVVIASPLGRDARCAHLPMRLFAERLAEAGFPVIRYDHAGTGESLDLDPAADAWSVWSADVGRVAAELRTRTGVGRVVLAGVRLGASLAVLRADAADGLLLLAPVLNGRSWLRKLRFSAGAGGQGDAEAEALDADGLRLLAPTTRGVASLDLLQADAPTGVPVLLASQGRINAAFADRLRACGAALSEIDFPGYDDLFLDAHSNHPPKEVFGRALAWMEDRFPGGRSVPPPPTAANGAAAANGSERPVCFGAGLRGTLHLPDPERRDGRAVLFCNTGGDPRAGIGGFAVQAGRALARRGVASLRFDFSGVGDSPGRPGEPRSHVYETGREADLDAALSLLGAEGFTRITAAGVCSGAYHALAAAIADPRIEGAFAINPVKLIWRPGDSLALGRRDDGRATRVYMGKARSLQTWGRLLKGEVDVQVVLRTLAARFAARLAHRRDPRTLALRRGVARLSARGGRACLLMGLEDASLDEVERCFGPEGVRFAALPGLSVRLEPALDHGLTRSTSRTTALTALLNWLS